MDPKSPADFTVKRRWDDDAIFKNQARGTDEKGKKEFVNDLLKSGFHKKFMVNTGRLSAYACQSCAKKEQIRAIDAG
ncbi:Cwf15/Cwc15 cell cycle control protein-domain-containing protein [Sphaerosporella brunnea]|uniref:Cwf15/Cwc15 cell cycle control protein-domain-containing protein n=1 Tax=Sphaerosporella brunnea TaxID=1250544 RepID=A0A5J5EYY6_9PEZI|nr:Cwf15/Cwc15 cell cycle control protein-domain-containing protein [Sphaerosporella brunnea]